MHDTHLHLDLFTNPTKVVKAIEIQKCYTIAVTNLPEVFFKTKELCSGYKYIRPAVGYHPELVYKFNSQLKLFIELLNETRYIGEVGLDNLRKSPDDFDSQKKIFEKIIDACSEKKNKILTIHSRRAEEEVISIIGNDFPGKVIMHWYSGSINNLAKALDCGFNFSINSAMINSAHGNNIIKYLPLENLLLESDSPFIGMDRDSATSFDASVILYKISKLKNISSEKLSKTLNTNFRNLTSL